MAVIWALTALLWVLLCGLIFAIGAMLFATDGQLSIRERVISTFVLLLLATPLALQIRTLGDRKREYDRNVVAPDDSGIKIDLGGAYRAAKGLPEVADTHIAWTDVVKITKERRKFIYHSLIPFEYPLDVYTIVSEEAEIPFTRECVIGAKRIAKQIAARLGQAL